MKKIIHLLLALSFLAFAYLNLNDPDAPIWVLGYGAAALLFALAVFGRADRRISGWYAVAMAVWMLTLSRGMIDWFRMGMPSITGTMQAHEPHIEVVREFLGLLIAVLALVWLTITTPRESRMGR
ncbi:MAG: transmembrane 220 family protein [Flavobacteriales bacterium]|nr:transmembrane 220 family protein [Flavobacteriales bacterium]